MREIVHIQAGQCGNQIGAKVGIKYILLLEIICLLNRVLDDVFIYKNGRPFK